VGRKDFTLKMKVLKSFQNFERAFGEPMGWERSLESGLEGESEGRGEGWDGMG
jgi:hypothetical protein